MNNNQDRIIPVPQIHLMEVLQVNKIFLSFIVLSFLSKTKKKKTFSQPNFFFILTENSFLSFLSLLSFHFILPQLAAFNAVPQTVREVNREPPYSVFSQERKTLQTHIIIIILLLIILLILTLLLLLMIMLITALILLHIMIHITLIIIIIIIIKHYNIIIVITTHITLLLLLLLLIIIILIIII